MAGLTGRQVVEGILAKDINIINSYMKNLYAGKISRTVAAKIIEAVVDLYVNFDLDHVDLPHLIAGLAWNDEFSYSSSEFVIGYILSKKDRA